MEFSSATVELNALKKQPSAETFLKSLFSIIRAANGRRQWLAIVRWYEL